MTDDYVAIVARQLAERAKCPEEYARNVADELLNRYLLLAVIAQDTDGKRLQPSRALEHAWQVALWHTRRYREHCRRIVGVTIDYEPCDKDAQRYADTLMAYKLLLGRDPPVALWPAADVKIECSPWVRILPGFEATLLTNLNVSGVKRSGGEAASDAKRPVPAGLAGTVFVKTLTGKVMTRAVSAGTTILQIKQSVEVTEAIPIAMQSMVWRGVQLTDDRTVASHGILDQSVIYLIFRRIG